MNITDYLKDASLTQQEFADMVGVTQGRVSHWLNGEKVPAERCVQIELATGGKVTRNELRPDVFGERQPERAAA